MAKDKELELKKEVSTEEKVADIDIDLHQIEKKRIRINGDNTKIIYINPSDLNIISRLNETYPKLKDLEEELTKLFDKDDASDFDKFATKLRSVDDKMRSYINYIFDYDVCTPCTSGGSMYDPIDGKMRYEYIIETLLGLYETGFTSEFGKIKQRVAKHTSKYHK